ncbi:MAG TPA: hypothetical protein VM925_00690 [Labilithrix sp.]|nr:hypothetical protein [Labilithrix sp.]
MLRDLVCALASIMSTLRGLIDFRPEERRNTFAAFAALLAITSGHTLLETARDALFLSKLPAAQLPWMYLALAALALVLSRTRKSDAKGAIAGMLVVGAALTAGFWALVGDAAPRPSVLYGLYVWSGLFASWVTVQLWTLLGRVHTMTQAKRLYGFIGAGAVLGGALGAVGARAALAFAGPRAMLLVSAAVFLVAIAPVLAIRAPSAAADARVEVEEEATSMTTGANLLWSDVFARRVLGIVLVATIAVTLSDFLFKARIAVAYPDARELAARLSMFYAVVNTVALFAQVVVGRWIFRVAGVQRALFLFPLLLFGAASGVLATGGALGAAVLLKAFDGTFRYSVHRTSMELLLVPVSDGTRERIKPIIELVGTRGGQAIASIAILGLVAIGAATTSTVGAFIFAFTVVWLALVITIRKHYLDVFRETLRSGGLSGKAELPELDLGALEMLFAGLSSSRDVEVLGSLELLAEQHRERLIPALILYHPSRDVVLRALQLFTELGRTDFVSIADRLNGHPDREVAAAALRARTAVLPDRLLLEKRLEEPCPQVSATALVALVARDWIDAAEADRRLESVLANRSWQTAAELARAIRDIGTDGHTSETAGRRFDALLIRLAREAGTFRDLACAPAEADAKLEEEGATAAVPTDPFAEPGMAPELRVRLETARAMAARKSPAFLPVLVGMLNRHELRATARAAIALIPGSLDFVDEVMAQRELARDVRVHLPRTMALLDPSAAAGRLLAHLTTEKDGAVRFKVLRALVKLRRANPKLPLDVDVLREAAERILDHAEELRRWGAALNSGHEEREQAGAGDDPLRAGHRLLVDLVRDKERHAGQRLFMVFELIYGEDFEDIERGLRSPKPKSRASSLELLENVIRPPLRGRVLALVGEGSSSAPILTYEQALEQILASGSSTMRTLAEYRALELGLDLGGVLQTRASQAATIESVGKRLVERARDLLTREPELIDGTGVTRAPV